MNQDAVQEGCATHSLNGAMEIGFLPEESQNVGPKTRWFDSNDFAGAHWHSIESHESHSVGNIQNASINQLPTVSLPPLSNPYYWVP